MRNIELKARLRNRAAAERACAEVGACHAGDLRQVDTYFRAAVGRLKLREKEPGADELIFYRRTDVAEARACDYRIVPAGPELRRALSEALGVIAVVKKVRSLWLWENVRIHLDLVECLGEFLEFEVVLDGRHDDADGQRKVAVLREIFGIDDSDVVPVSYVDLALVMRDSV